MNFWHKTWVWQTGDEQTGVPSRHHILRLHSVAR